MSTTVEFSASPPPGWDAFVRAHPRASFCHLAGWRDVFADALGHDMSFGVAREGEEIEGVLPLVSMPRLGRGRVLVSMPYLNYGGPVGTPSGCGRLTEAALEQARADGVRRLELRTRAAPSESESGDALAPGREKVTVLLDLPDDPEVLFKDTFRSKLRSQIRRPMKEDMEVRFGAQQMGPFYDVFSRNMRDLGTPVLPRRFFDLLAERFSDEVDFGVVVHEGRAVAAGCGFHFGDEFEMTWASSLREYNRLSPNMLLYWRFMERAIERGRRVFNFGRCTPGGGTHRFKMQWESRDEPLHWRQWPADDQAPDPDDDAFGLAVRVWQRLPLVVANHLGPRVARRIPTF